jgi:hypothetical protein
MKQKLIIIVAILAALVVAQTVTIQGYKNVTTQYVYFDPGSTNTDSTTKLLLRGNSTADTIWADSSGTLVQIDGTADSCSYPFFLTDYALRTSGVVEYNSEPSNTHPIQTMAINVLIEADGKDSNQVKFHIDTRDWVREKNATGHWRWKQTAWTPRGFEKSGGGFTVLDTVITDSTQSTSKQRQKLHFNVTGDEARLCPEITTLFGNDLTDSVWIDSIMYQGR